jgi:uncharacterized protein YggE
VRASPTTVAVLAGAALIAGAVALRPASVPSTAPAFAAAKATDDPTALAEFLRFGGTATVTVRPDQAELGVTTTGEAASASAALAESSRRMRAVIERLRALGIAKDDLQSTGVWSSRAYEAPRHYQASNSLRVLVRDPDAAGRILTAATDAGAEQVSGPSFSVADQRAAYRDALRRAIQDARAKADAAAAEMGVRVTGVVSVADQGPVATPMYDMAARASAGGASPEVPIEQGKLDVNASVTVVFGYAR